MKEHKHELTRSENAVLGYIADLMDSYDELESTILEKPIDYLEGKTEVENFLLKIARKYWLSNLPKEI